MAAEKEKAEPILTSMLKIKIFVVFLLLPVLWHMQWDSRELAKMKIMMAVASMVWRWKTMPMYGANFYCVRIAFLAQYPEEWKIFKLLFRILSGMGIRMAMGNDPLSRRKVLKSLLNAIISVALKGLGSIILNYCYQYYF